MSCRSDKVLSLSFFFLSCCKTAKRASLFNSVTLLFVFVQFADMLFEVEIPAESFSTFFACKWLLVIVCVHVKCQIVHLMESFAADVALEGFLACVCQPVIFIVSFLVKSFAANIAYKWLVTSVDANVSVQRRRSVESFSANVTFVRFFFRMDDFVPAEGACLTEALTAYLTLKRARASMHRHVTRKVVMCVENFAANLAGEGLRGAVTSFAANRTSSGARHRQRRGFCVFQPEESTSGDENTRARVAVIAASRRRHYSAIQTDRTMISGVVTARHFLEHWLPYTNIAVVGI